MTTGWQYEVRWLVGIGVPAVSVAWLSGEVALVALAVLGGYLVRHLYFLSRLSGALAARRKLRPPLPSGLWGDVFEDVQALQARSRKRKRRLSRFFIRFRAASAILPDAVVVLGQGARVEWANPASAKLLGLVWPGVTGQTLTALVREPVLAEYLGGEDFSRPLVMPSPVNRAVILSVYVSPFFDKKQERLLVARDITEVYHLDQSRRDFVANVSHELRTPLTVISGFLETLVDANGEIPLQGRSLELMRQQAARMENIIGDLLALARLEQAEQALEGEPVRVADLLASIIEAARELSGGRGHELVLEVDPGLGLHGDSDELASAFSNLVFNAVRHTPPRTRVVVRWARDGDGACLSVADNGIGIPARDIPRLTERFYRIDRGRSRESGGTGLGLAIVKRVLDRHQGELHIASGDGRGSTFSCYFPSARVVALGDLPGGERVHE